MTTKNVSQNLYHILIIYISKDETENLLKKCIKYTRTHTHTNGEKKLKKKKEKWKWKINHYN